MNAPRWADTGTDTAEGAEPLDSTGAAAAKLMVAVAAERTAADGR